MPVTIDEKPGTDFVEVHLSGKLEKNDYHHFIPAVERLVHDRGKINMLVDMSDFHGWTTGALWEDLKFDAKHFSDLKRVAMVGEKKWQQAMSVVCKPFTAATVRYFDRTETDLARAWAQAG